MDKTHLSLGVPHWEPGHAMLLEPRRGVAGAALRTGRHQVSRKHQCCLKNSSSSSHRQQCSARDCRGKAAIGKSDSEKLWETYPILTFPACPATCWNPSTVGTADRCPLASRGWLEHRVGRILWQRLDTPRKCAIINGNGWATSPPWSYHPSSVGTQFWLESHQ